MPDVDLFELGDDNQAVYWLDLTTGRQLTSPARAPVVPAFLRNPTQREAELLAPVIAVLTERGHTIDPSKTTLNTRIRGHAATYDIGIFANGESEILCSYTFMPTPVPPHRRSAVAEAMTRINTQIWIGNFEMNPADGYMRFRMNADVEGVELARTAAERLVYTGARAWDDHYDTLMCVARAQSPTLTDSRNRPN